MKKKILAAILTATLLIAGCSDMANVSAGQDNTMVLVEGWRDYGIYADKDTASCIWCISGMVPDVPLCSMQTGHRRSGRERNKILEDIGL